LVERDVDQDEPSMKPKSKDAQADTPKLAYSLKEWCERSNIGLTKTYQLIAAGELKSRRVGRHRIILHSDGEEYLNSLPVD
jgi:excisionase family DNA binding protein